MDFLENALDEVKSFDLLINREIKSYLSGNKFELVGTINVPFKGHFNCMIINPVFFKKEPLHGAWIHDGLLNNGSLTKLKDFKELTQNNPYVLIYKRG